MFLLFAGIKGIAPRQDPVDANDFSRPILLEGGCCWCCSCCCLWIWYCCCCAAAIGGKNRGDGGACSGDQRAGRRLQEHLLVAVLLPQPGQYRRIDRGAQPGRRALRPCRDVFYQALAPAGNNFPEPQIGPGLGVTGFVVVICPLAVAIVVVVGIARFLREKRHDSAIDDSIVGCPGFFLFLRPRVLLLLLLLSRVVVIVVVV